MLLLYEFSTAFVVISLPVVLIIGIELGHWLGRRFAGRVTDEAQDHIRTMKAALLGMISLLLAFTFSQALERFNARSAAVVDEANAIGTAVLRRRPRTRIYP